ncbi:MAG: hypothetical protein KME57_11280 [Scytonema hyalinum WJT4-NPBG1]|nr:hypothetical protein [Scytonema hyalinum WJT4-NPBG1]
MEDAIATLFCLLFCQEWKPRLALTLSTQGTQGLVCVNALGLGVDLRVKPRLLFTGAWCYLIPPLTPKRCFCLRFKCWRYMFYISRLKRGQR